MSNNKNLVFEELTEEDKKEYKEFGKKSLKIRLIIFLICLSEFFVCTYELYKEKSYILIIIFSIFYISCIWGGYVLYFLFPPVGIKYGRISKQTYKRNGRYSAAVYNVYFPEERKSIKDIWIRPTKKYPAPKVKDEVKVVKSRFGKFYVYVVKGVCNKNVKKR